MQAERLSVQSFCTQFVESFAHGKDVAEGVVVLEAGNDLGIYFDRNHLNQILWNLLDNAIRHASGAPGSVRLSAVADETRGMVELHVIDDGEGVPEAVRAQIFEPFFTTHHLGTGLGLFIARELCEANGASLELAADVDRGHFIIAGRSDTCLLSEANVAPVAS